MASRLVVVIASATLAIIFFGLSYYANNPELKSVFASIVASFIFLLFLETGIYIKTSLVKRELKKFFGQNVTKDSISLVYPDFVLSREVEDCIKHIPTQHRFVKDKEFLGNKGYCSDVPRIVAQNDVKALIYVASLFGSIAQQTPKLLVDHEAVQDREVDRSFVSFGLSSNYCTHMVREHIMDRIEEIRDNLRENEVAPNPLFDIYDPDKPKEPEELWIYKKNSVTPEKLVSKGELQYGMVVRYRPYPVDHPNRYWFLVSGLGHIGTTGAAWYLANKWQKLSRIAGSHDFVAVFKVPLRIDAETKLVKRLFRTEDWKPKPVQPNCKGLIWRIKVFLSALRRWIFGMKRVSP
jgi:hypothetical protein